MISPPLPQPYPPPRCQVRATRSTPDHQTQIVLRSPRRQQNERRPSPWSHPSNWGTRRCRFITPRRLQEERCVHEPPSLLLRELSAFCMTNFTAMSDNFCPLPAHAIHLDRRSLVLLCDILLDLPSPSCPVLLLVASTISQLRCSTCPAATLDDFAVPGMTILPIITGDPSSSYTTSFPAYLHSLQPCVRFFSSSSDHFSPFCSTYSAVILDDSRSLS